MKLSVGWLSPWKRVASDGRSMASQPILRNSSELLYDPILGRLKLAPMKPSHGPNQYENEW